MGKGKCLQWSTAFLAATPLVVSEHHYHIDPQQPQQPGSLWATTISGTAGKVAPFSAAGASPSAGTFDLRAG